MLIDYYRDENEVTEFSNAGGLEFPNEKEPDFLDFAYFSFVIGMTCQVSDVQVSSQGMRRLALVHGLLSFRVQYSDIGSFDQSGFRAPLVHRVTKQTGRGKNSGVAGGKNLWPETKRASLINNGVEFFIAWIPMKHHPNTGEPPPILQLLQLLDS